MITAAVAPVDNVTNATAAWVVLALLAVFAICATLWHHERISDRQTARIDTHDEQLAELAYQMPALLEWLGIEIPAPVEDDSPEALAEIRTHEPEPIVAFELPPDEMLTDEFPALPNTEPMAVVDPTPAVQARRDAAWDEQRPSPVRRYPEEFPAPTDSDDIKAQRAAWVEEQLREIRARIDAGRAAS